MKRFFSKLSIYFLVFCLVSQSFMPSIAYTQPKEPSPAEELELYQLIEDLELENNIILHEHTYIYGIETDKKDSIEIQYADEYITVSLNNFEEADLPEKERPVLVEVNPFDSGETEIFIKDDAFYALYPDENERVLITEDIEYPVYQDELGLKFVYFGNTVFYLNQQDRQIAKDAIEAEKNEEPSNEEEVIPDETKAGFEKEQEPQTEDTSDDDLVNETEKEDTSVAEAATEEEIESETIKEQDNTALDNSILNKESEATLRIHSTTDVWKGSSANYFKVNVDNLVVYSKGNTKELGALVKNQVYPIHSNYGNWHQIQFGNTKGYVYKADTIPDNGSNLKNKNNNYNHSKQSFVALQDVTVYDNSSGKLVKFGKINSGERYPIVSEYGRNWSRVVFADRVGYVLNSEARHEFTGEEKHFTVLTSNLPVYDNRTGSLKQVGTLTKGQAYEIVSDYGNWHRIQYNNHYGYVFKADTEPADGAYIRNENNSLNHSKQSFTAVQNTIVYDNTGGTLRAFGTIDKGQSYYIVSDYGNWWRIIFADRVGYVQKGAVKQNFIGGEKHFRVLTSDLPIYDNRSGSLEQVGTLTKGQEYEVVSNYGNWHRIQFDDYYGYVLKANTEPTQGKYLRNKNTTFNHMDREIISLNNVIVYDNSSGALKPFGRIGNGQSYHIASDYGNWWRIIFADRVGYVYKGNVQEIDDTNKGAFMVTEDASISVVKDNQRVWVATLKKGNTFQKIAEQGNWLKVKFGDQIGNVWKPATREANYNFIVKRPVGTLLAIVDAPLYENVNQSRLAAIIEAGETMETTRKVNNQWYEVTVAGRNLFVQSDYVIDTDNPSFQKSNHPYVDTLRAYMINSPFIYDDINTPQNETVEHANLMLQNKIRFPSYNNGNLMDYTKGINWVQGQGVESQHQRSFLRQLHGLFFINDLVEAYYITGNERYITKGYEYINAWITANPYHKPKHNMAWHDEGTARRLATLVNLFEAGKNVLNDQQKLNLFELMVFHADLLSTDHFYAANTNHGMFQDEALIVFSKYFYDKKIFSHYYSLAIDRMSGYFDSLISSDGVHLEHSPSYHQIIARALEKYSEALTAFGDTELAKKFSVQYDSMALYATHVIKPDGKWPLIADTYGGDRPISSMWQNNPYYQYAFSKGRNGIAPKETNVVFPKAGYAIFRDQWTTPDEGAYIFFTAAYHTNYHKHSDDLSLWIYDGQDIITEAGPHSYTLSDPITSYAYSSFGHNTLIVDDEGLPRVDGKYDLTYLEDYNLDNPLKPSVTGVNKRYNGVTHKRNVIYDKTDRIIEVNDSMTSNKQHNYKLLWHLAPDITPLIDYENNKVVLTKHGEELMTIRFSSDQAIKLSSVYGDEHEIYKSWTFDNTKANAMIDVHTLIVEMDGSSGGIKTTFELQ